MTVVRQNIVWIIIIFLLSSIFRIFFLDLIEFKSDEATTLYQTIQFFKSPYLIERGLISGTGVYNFPFFNYLIIALSIFSQDPQILSLIIALLNSFLVCVFFILIRKYYNFITALFASLLLAFSPWGVLFSRKIWAQDLINLILFPILFILHELILFKKTKPTFWLFFLLTLLVQLHGSGVFFLATTILILLISKIKIDIKKAIVGILVGLIPALPYFLFQLKSIPFCPDCDAFFRYQQSFRTFDFLNLLRPFQVITGLGFHFILGKSYSEFIFAHPLINYLKYVFATTIPVTLVGILFALHKRDKYLFLTIYFIAIPVLYLITKTTAYIHYFVIIIPVSILLFVIPITNILTFIRSKFIKVFIFFYFLLILFSNIFFLSSFYQFLDSKKKIEGDYGPIYSETKDFIENQTRDYKTLSYYQEVVSFAYIYAQSEDLHLKLGEFFLQKGETELAKKEFKK